MANDNASEMSLGTSRERLALIDTNHRNKSTMPSLDEDKMVRSN